jgi:protein O-GlcNAc transferase
MQRAVKLSPYTAEDHCNPGVTLKDLGRMDEAEASFIQALEINPSFVKGYYNLGNMLRGVGRLDEA